MYLSRPDRFTVSISAPAHGGGNDRNFFYMTPISGNGKNNQVRLALDLPFEQVTPGGAYQINTINTVRNEKQGRQATDTYSTCPGSVNTYAGGRVCKPLSFLVVDDDSIPGATYGTDLDIEVTTQDGHKVLRETIYVTYTNTSSPIGIYSTRDRLSLTPENHFTDSSTFCVFSRSAKAFDVRVEGDHRNDRLILHGRGGNYLAYDTRVYLNHFNVPEPVKPFEWASGGIPFDAKNVWGCRGRNNLEVQVNIPVREARAAKPGRYTGVLTVRVRAI